MALPETGDKSPLSVSSSDDAAVAQLDEHRPSKSADAGSSPVSGTTPTIIIGARCCQCEWLHSVFEERTALYTNLCPLAYCPHCDHPNCPDCHFVYGHPVELVREPRPF